MRRATVSSCLRITARPLLRVCARMCASSARANDAGYRRANHPRAGSSRNTSKGAKRAKRFKRRARRRAVVARHMEMLRDAPTDANVEKCHALVEPPCDCTIARERKRGERGVVPQTMFTRVESYGIRNYQSTLLPSRTRQILRRIRLQRISRARKDSCCSSLDALDTQKASFTERYVAHDATRLLGYLRTCFFHATIIRRILFKFSKDALRRSRALNGKGTRRSPRDGFDIHRFLRFDNFIRLLSLSDAFALRSKAAIIDYNRGGKARE